jgi:hypothetical protein
MTRGRRRGAGTFALLVALSGCGAAPTEVAPPVPTSPPVAHDDADQRAAEHALPGRSDVGPEFRESPFVPPASAGEDDATLSACIGRPPTADHETARAYSPRLTAGDGTEIAASVTFVDTVDTARADLAALAAEDRARPCLRDLLASQLGTLKVLAAVEVTRTVPPPGGQDVVAYRAVVRTVGPPVVLDLVSTVKGRAEVQASFRNPAEPLPAEVQARLVRTIVGRLS